MEDRTMRLDLLCSWVLGALLISGWVFEICDGFGTFGFDMHHRFSDPVKGMLDVGDLPEKHSLQYYKTMAQRDRLIHGRRRLSATDEVKPPLTFADGNETYRIDFLGFLHYANISVGTPSLWFLVALDTGSGLFWLPCDCISCVGGIKTRHGMIDFNIYSPNASSTSENIPCDSTSCPTKNRCSGTQNTCPYQVSYASSGTSSTGFLVEDMLHLITDDDDTKVTDAQITMGCGRVQTGSFLEGGAPNGLFGLSGSGISVPSILAKEGLVAHSFSMCFGADGNGRISFGDKGSSDQGETPFNPNTEHSLYNVTITQIIVEGIRDDLNFDAVFDSGTSFTYLNDPAYTILSKSFNLTARDKRYSSESNLPFEYCYISPNQSIIEYPSINLIMKGGDQFSVTDSIVTISIEDGFVYCLGVVKSKDINIIGQNFMTGYRIIFDTEKMVLGWKKSNCYGTKEVETLPLGPGIPPAVPPTVAVEPEATGGDGNENGSHMSQAPSPSANTSPTWNPSIFALLIVSAPILAIVL